MSETQPQPNPSASADVSPGAPPSLSFRCALTLECGVPAKDNPPPRFSMVAYTGGLMKVSGFDHPVVVDVSGVMIERQRLPIRLEHNARQGVGHTERIAIVGGQIVAEGVISRDTVWARDVARSAARGFPWQASIGADIVASEFVPAGMTVSVNGQSFSGPVYVIRQCALKEISFVDSGADSQTSAQVSAAAAQTRTLTLLDKDMPMETEHHDTNEHKTLTAGSHTIADADKQMPSGPVGAAAVAAAAPEHLPDVVQQMRQSAAQEAHRIGSIRALCAGGHADIEARAIAEGWDAMRCELELLRATRPSAPAVVSARPAADPKVFEAVALMAAGVPERRLTALYDAPTLEAADKLRGIGIQEYCERIAGGGAPFPRFRRDASGWLQAAFSTLSLPGILSNVANKMLLEGYTYIEDAWRKICKIASVNDFKEHTRYRMTGSFAFEKVGADGELKHGRLAEQTFTQKADTHGIMFALTRQMIINDDLGAFADIPRSIGMGAAEAIADAVWGLWLSNPNGFFSEAHQNYLAGADTALSVDSLTLAELTFSQQTKPNGRPLGISPSILLVPTALKVPAQLLMSSAQLNETTTVNKGKPSANPHVGKFEVVSSAYLANASFSGASSKAWYLLADPNRLPALEVAFLNGVDRPTVEKTDADFNTLGIQFRGYIDFGVREQDWRGALKVKGEA